MYKDSIIILTDNRFLKPHFILDSIEKSVKSVHNVPETGSSGKGRGYTT